MNSVSQPAAAPTPVTTADRHELIDSVRGFALFGVLLANLIWTTQFVALTDAQRDALPTEDVDRVAQSTAMLLVDGKFYTLFSMLFGLGFAVQLTRAAERGQRILPTYIRRLAILFAIGVAHSVFVWFGDILQFYALLGFVLILFRNASDRVLLGTAFSIGGFFAVLPTLHWLAGPASAVSEGDGTVVAFAALAEGRYLDVVAYNWSVQVEFYSSIGLGHDGFVYWQLGVLWKMLLGFWLGRRLVLQRASDHLATFRRVLPWALAVGLTGNAIWVVGIAGYDTWIATTDSALRLLWILVELGVAALALAYLCALVLLYHKASWRRVLAWLAPTGRMALTNYLTHSVLYVVLFYGIGFGLLGDVGTAGCWVITVLIYGLQIVGSNWWLQRFRFGPAEWAWRSLTYGQPQPMRQRS